MTFNYSKIFFNIKLCLTFFCSFVPDHFKKCKNKNYKIK